jgi:hypothetical protein
MAEHVTFGLIWLRIAAVDVPNSVKRGVHSFERLYVPFLVIPHCIWFTGNTNMATVHNFDRP